MTKTDLTELIKESNKYSEEAQYLAKLMEHLILFQSEKFKKLEQKINKIQELQNQQFVTINIIACNLNPIFSFEKLSSEDE